MKICFVGLGSIAARHIRGIKELFGASARIDVLRSGNGKMPEQRKMIYTLSRQEGLSNAEIAIQLNTTKRNVESQLSLALKEIRKAISCFLLSFL